MARDVGERLELLWRDPTAPDELDAATMLELRGGRLPAELAGRYEGELAIALRPDRPTVVSNFVSTLDGVVAMTIDGKTGGGDVSGFSEPDRFMMALLRSLADAVIVGAGTFGADAGHEWTPRRVHPPSARATSNWRADLGLAAQPTTVVVTSSGRLDPDHPGLGAADVPVVVVTTRAGAAELRRRGVPDRVSIEAVASTNLVPVGELVAILDAVGVRLAVCEGGPQLLGEFLAAGAIDELFLTLAPHLAGRTQTSGRRSLVEGVSLGEASGLWGRLREVHRSASHLFLRYDLRR